MPRQAIRSYLGCHASPCLSVKTSLLWPVFRNRLAVDRGLDPEPSSTSSASFKIQRLSRLSVFQDLLSFVTSLITGETHLGNNLLSRWRRQVSAIDQRELLEMVADVPSWWHSIDLGHDIVTPGVKTVEALESNLLAMQLPPLAGKSVLDIGAWDGYFSFAAEHMGARRVVALDHYVWSMDLIAQVQHFHECHAQGRKPPQWEEVPSVWRPDELPGKRGFDTVHRALGSQVESHVEDFMIADLDQLGTFDVVMYLGVLYHMKDPLRALERLAKVTSEVAVIETAAYAVPGFEHQSMCEFYASDELNADSTNWWAPNLTALTGLCQAAGFDRVKVLVGPGDMRGMPAGEVQRYRAIVHAWK